jgi:hypothetical protein
MGCRQCFNRVNLTRSFARIVWNFGDTIMKAKANSQRLNLIGNGEKSEQDIADRMRPRSRKNWPLVRSWPQSRLLSIATSNRDLSNQIDNDTFASQEVDSLSLSSRLLQVHSMQLIPLFQEVTSLQLSLKSVSRVMAHH